MRSQTAISLVLTASVALGGGGIAPAFAAPAAGLSIKVGQAKDFSRLEFDGAQPHSVRRDGADLVLTFEAAASPDLAQLRVAPPRFLKAASARTTSAGLELRLTLAPDVLAKAGRADGGAYVILYPDPAAAPPDQTPRRAVSAAPASGTVTLRPELQHGVLRLHFDWARPLGAAVFRRGDSVWVVFDTKAVLDLSQAPRGLPQASRVTDASGPDTTAVRLIVPASVQVSASAQGGSWTVALGADAGPASGAVAVKPDLAATPAELTAQLAGATGVFWIDDPTVGDRLAVVTALAPAKGVAVPRSLVEADVLASVHGLALAPHVQDLTVRTDGDIVHIGRPNGLALSAGTPSVAASGVSGATDLPRPAAMPALVDFDGWSAIPPGGFLSRYNALQAGAAEEGAKGKDAPVRARLGLARFLVGSELGFEAIGVLNLLGKTDPLVLGTAEFRGLRGAARAISGRYKDAQADFSSPALLDDPASALWRAYLSARLGDPAGARSSFASGRSALPAFNARWRARFAEAVAEADLDAQDATGAGRLLDLAGAAGPVGDDAQRLKLDRARMQEAQGHADGALALYDAAAASDAPGIATAALLRATEIRQASGKLPVDQAVQVLNSIRFRWRGDAVELEAARALGRIYIGQGRYREALEALRASSRNLPDLPAAVGVQADLSGAFRNLFLDGGADGLPPLQSLALFQDFKDLTPVGADGDLMVRKLARRLVDVDLLDQAATLLKYQADNRLDGVPRAEVDTDLALIELMDRQPEAALDALNASRTTLLPSELQSRRRVIQARALSALGRDADALEIIAEDTSADAGSVRADIAWKTRDWPTAGRLLEVALGQRYRSPKPLEPVERGELLRAAIAYSLAGDNAGLTRLRTRYGKLAEAADHPNALRVALAGADGGGFNAAALTGAPEADTFATWVRAMKAHLMDGSILARG